MDKAHRQDLWTASGYREFLRDWFEAEKRVRPTATLGVLGRRLALDPSLLGKILQGERHLATSRIQPVCDLVGLAGNEAEFFRCLVLHAKSKTAREAQVLFERMQELRRIAPVPLSDAQDSYWDKWIHIALRSLLSCGDFAEDWDRMGELLHPRQSARAVKAAMRSLESLGMVARDRQGFWRPTEPFVKDGAATQVRALRNFHRQSLLLAVESLDGLSRENRHITSSTMAIDEEEYRELARMVEDLRSRALTRAAQVERPDRVVQLAVQLVSLAGEHLRGSTETV